MRLSYTLWGGRFNPIIVVDDVEEANLLVDVFRVDVVLPVGSAEALPEFVKRFPHLITPFSLRRIISEPWDRSELLDIHNQLVHFRETPEWRAIKAKGLRLYEWDGADPLADVFLQQFGSYPSEGELGIDYRGLVTRAADPSTESLAPTAPIPAAVLDHPSIPFLSSHSLRRHHTVAAGWDSPGFFVGDAANLADLVCHWNLRAAHIPLWFVDPKHIGRYEEIIPRWDAMMRELVASRPEYARTGRFVDTG